MNKLLIGAIGISLLITVVGWFSWNAGADSTKAKMADVIKEAVKKAREQEQIKQGKVNEIIQKQYTDITAINDSLNASIDRLRNRPSRRYLPDKSKANCKGTTGESLSSEDGRFLIWEATRADRLRIALKACYKYADTVD